MTDAEDPRELLVRAIEQAGDAVAAVRDDQLGLPTPCRSWDVAALVNHLVHDLEQFRITATGGTADWSAPPADVSGNRAGAFRDRAAALITTARQAPEPLGTIALPGIGEVPARFPIDQATTEFAVHTWDLAVATGQPTDLDPDVGRAALDFMRGALQARFRGDEQSGKAFGPEVGVASDAPLYDRLAAFAGRQPR